VSRARQKARLTALVIAAAAAPERPDFSRLVLQPAVYMRQLLL
jgi:hypothetical protein